MDETRVEIDIEISRAMQIIDSTAEWELRELQTFTSTLCGLQHVSAESNPLRPIVYASALWDAAGEVSPAQADRAIAAATVGRRDRRAAEDRLGGREFAPGGAGRASPASTGRCCSRRVR